MKGYKTRSVREPDQKLQSHVTWEFVPKGGTIQLGQRRYLSSFLSPFFFLQEGEYYISTKNLGNIKFQLLGQIKSEQTV